MNGPANKTPSALLSYFSLFSSVGTLLCCALPSLLVLAGLGASVASTLATFPWPVTLSHHKPWTFGVSGILIAASFANMCYFAPRLRAHACSPENPEALRRRFPLQQSPTLDFRLPLRSGLFRCVPSRPHPRPPGQPLKPRPRCSWGFDFLCAKSFRFCLAFSLVAHSFHS